MSTATVTTATTRPRAVRWALGVLQVLLAAVYLFSAAGKISLEPMVVAGFAMMGIGTAGTVAIGVVELAAAVGLLVPRLAGLAAAGCVALMTGAVIITASTLGGTMILVPAVVLVLVAVVSWVRRHETVALLRNPRAVLLGR
ncbi:DoxX family protein [Actinomycetospora lemnae]|uniref:DoxX family protein n=1 Tax=Actinomycetospora lemnae TaxID=3019891 RepID=A0ABT5SUY6_9PSEU|nr:DoxX family protein [Actinomycetospora sp. DW7H6]MDD7966668.1 DoxX family protein [Actinomycetospora sp. DW7H6]